MAQQVKKVTALLVDWLRDDAAAERALAQTVQEWVESGDALQLHGRDLLRLNAAGEIERIQNFANLDGSFALVELPPELLALIGGDSLARINEAPGVLLAQAETSQTPAIEAAPTTTNSQVLAQTAIGVVMQASGTVVVLRNGTSQVLAAGDSLYLGDIISTESGSNIKVNFVSINKPGETLSSTTIGEGTKVTLNGEWGSSGGTASSEPALQVRMFVESGSVQVDNVSDQGFSLRVQTPAGQMAVPNQGLNVVVQGEDGQTLLSQSTAQSTDAPATILFEDNNGRSVAVPISNAPTTLSAQQVNAASTERATPAPPNPSQQPTELTTAAPQLSTDPPVVSITTPTASVPNAQLPVTSAPLSRPLSDAGREAPISGASPANPLQGQTATTRSAPSAADQYASTLAPGGPTFLIPTSPQSRVVEELAPPIIPGVSLRAGASTFDEASGKVVFNVTLSSPTSLIVGFGLRIQVFEADGITPATDGRIGTLNFSGVVPAGNANHVFEVPVTTNTVRESGLVIKATLEAPSNCVIDAATAQVNLTDAEQMRGSDGANTLTGGDADRKSVV